MNVTNVCYTPINLAKLATYKLFAVPFFILYLYFTLLFLKLICFRFTFCEANI